MKLAHKFAAALKEIDEVELYCCDKLDNHLSTVTLNIEGIEAGDVGIMLDVDHNIATRTGLHCAPLVHEQLGILEIHGGVRFSIGAFNTDEHIDAAVHALEEIAASSPSKKKVVSG